MPSLHRDILGLYAELDAEIVRRHPHCNACGECCDFPKQGFVLYATSAEVGLVTANLPAPGAWDCAELCPFHQDGKCHNRAYRPVGCRTYFCDPKFSVPGPLTYTRFHERLKAIIAHHGHPYRYAPFLTMLAETWGPPDILTTRR